MKKVNGIIPQIVPTDLFHEIVNSEDIAYTHSLFVQCFLPVRHNARNRERWNAANGQAAMLITAGDLINPAKFNDWKHCEVPAGSAARDLIVYTIDYIRRHKTRTIPLGHSFREGMTKLGVPIGGPNGKALARELANFAACDINFGLWTEHGARQENARVVKRMNFWLERDPDQRTIWQPDMDVTQDFYDSVMDSNHITPVYLPAHNALRQWPLAQDIHKWLVYRMRDLRRPVTLSAAILHSVFGGDTRSLRHFWDGGGKSDRGFVANFHRALQYYPSARVEILNDGIKLKPSPALIPYKKLGWIEAPKSD